MKEIATMNFSRLCTFTVKGRKGNINILYESSYKDKAHATLKKTVVFMPLGGRKDVPLERNSKGFFVVLFNMEMS
jgi:hypothetical protein